MYCYEIIFVISEEELIMYNSTITLKEASELTGVSFKDITKLLSLGVLTAHKELRYLTDKQKAPCWVRCITWDQLDVISRYRTCCETIDNARRAQRISTMPTIDFLDAREEALYDELKFVNEMRNYLERHGY
jgi:hypothetical protein